MMIIHLSALTVLFIILFREVATSPYRGKQLVRLDISGEMPREIRRINHEELPGTCEYIIKRNRHCSHVIGDVKDSEGNVNSTESGREDGIIVRGDPLGTRRDVFVIENGHGSKYVNVTTSRSWTGTKTVQEFVKVSRFGRFRRIIRRPISMNILTQEDDEFITVTPQHATKTFKVKPDRGFEVVIGMVKYGDHTLESEVHGLLYREVIWEGGLDAPIITITSRHTDGTESEIKHKIDNTGHFQVFYFKRKLSPLYKHTGSRR